MLQHSDENVSRRRIRQCRRESIELLALDRDQRLKNPGPSALRTLSGLREPFPVEDETALLAPRGLDHHTFACGAGRTDRVLKIDFDVVASQAELLRE